jgi:hypothetical protein
MVMIASSRRYWPRLGEVSPGQPRRASRHQGGVMRVILVPFSASAAISPCWLKLMA